MRRLNETEEVYKESQKILENKCLKSNFNPKFVTNQFKKIHERNFLIIICYKFRIKIRF